MKLPASTAALSGFTDVYRLTEDAVTTLGTGGTVKIAELPPGAHITNCIVAKTQAHAGTSTDLVLDVGIIDGDADGFIDNVSLVDLVSSAAGNGYLFTGGVVQATATINPTGNDNSVLYTAVDAGTAGNSITVAYVDPSANDAALSVDVTGTDIVVNLATDGGGLITSTAAQVITVVNNSAAASALVTAAASGTVTGVVAAVTETALTGGESAASSRNSYANETASTVDIGAKPTFTGTVTGGEYLICMTILNPNVLKAV